MNASGVHLFGAAAPGDALLDGVTPDIVELPYRDAKRWLAENGPGEESDAPFASRSEFFRGELPQDAIAELVEHFPTAGRSASSTSARGAAPTTRSRPTPPRSRTAPSGSCSSRPPAPTARTGSGAHTRSPTRTASGGAYVNFPDRELDDPLTAYHGANLDRLRRVKAQYDPDGVFRFPQSI